MLELNALPDFRAGFAAELVLEFLAFRADPDQFEFPILQAIQGFHDDVRTLPVEKGADAKNAQRGELWSAVNSVYARIMGDHRPARAVIPVKDLHYGFKIEIEAVAATNS